MCCFKMVWCGVFLGVVLLGVVLLGVVLLGVLGVVRVLRGPTQLNQVVFPESGDAVSIGEIVGTVAFSGDGRWRLEL